MLKIQNLTKTFIEKFPSSHYLDDVFTIQGDSYYRLKRYDTAIETWFKALEYSHEYQLKKILKKSCWECRYQDLKGITFLGRCLRFKEHNMEVKEIPPHKVDEGCKHFAKK